MGFMPKCCAVAAYRRCGWRTTRSTVVPDCYLLRMCKESADFGYHKFGNLDMEWDTFQHLLVVHRNMKRIEKRV